MTVHRSIRVRNKFRPVAISAGPGRLWGLLAVIGLLMGSACGGGGGTKKTRKRGAQRPPGASSANLRQVGKPSPEVRASLKPKRKAATTKRKTRRPSGIELPQADVFTERDLVESEQESRDPFRNYLIKEPTKAPAEVIQPGDTVYLKDFSLSELKVTGIVGSTRRYAMVLDPRSGRTTIVKTRDQIGKERALIFQINRDHLVMLVPRKKRDEKQDPYERRTLFVDEARKIVDIGSDALRPDEGGIRYSWPRRRQRRTPRPKEP